MLKKIDIADKEALRPEHGKTKMEVSPDIGDMLQLGWLSCGSAVANVICPDLVVKAHDEGWDGRRFFGEAIKRIPDWARSKLRIDDFLVGETSQNFVIRMMTQRPDLFYDASKGSMSGYLAGLLWRVYRETERGNRSYQGDDFVLDRVDSSDGPLDVMIGKEDCKAQEIDRAVVRELLEELRPDQRDAVKAKYCPGYVSDSSREVPEPVLRVRRTRGLNSLRKMAQARGLDLCKAGGTRRRMRRSRRRTRGRGLPKRPGRAAMELRETARYGTVSAGQPEKIGMSAKEEAIKVKNERALQALFDSLPEGFKERVDVLEIVRRKFEQEFARHGKRRPRSTGNKEGAPGQ